MGKRNLKKVLALTLAFASVATTFAGASNFTDVQVSDDNSSAINMLSDLKVLTGYSDGTFKPQATITRAEACQVIANLMNGGLADVNRYAGGSNFTDVPKSYWGEPAIAYCVQNGIAVGTGNGKFEPERPITDAEYITMMDRALGYETADHKLEYPYGHMSIAQAKGLLDDTQVELNSSCLRAEVAQISYNGLFADYARATSFDNTVHGSTNSNYTSLIREKFGLDRAFVTSNKDTALGTDATKCWGHEWVIIGEDCDNENSYIAMPIADNSTDVGKSISFKSTTDLSNYIGYRVEIYNDVDHSTTNPSVKAVRLIAGQQTYDYNPTMADSKTDDKITVGDKALTLKKDVDATTEKDMNYLDGSQYQLFDWNNDGVIDFVKNNSVDYYYVEYANSDGSVVRLKSTDGKHDISTSMSKNTVKCESGESVDEIVFNTYDGIASGDIVEVSTKFSTISGKHTVTYDLTEVESKTMELTKASTKGTYMFDGEEHKIADDAFTEDVISNNPENLNFYSNGKLGDDYDLYLNRNGMVIASGIGKATSSYLMVTGYGEYTSGSSGVRRDNAELDVIYADGSQNKEPLKISKNADITIDGKSKNIWDGYTFTSGNGSQLVGSVFSYKLDGDNEVTELTEICDLDDSTGAFEYDDSNMVLYNNSGKEVADLDGASAVFVVSNGWDNNITSTNSSRVNTRYVDVLKPNELPDIDKYTGGTTRNTQGKDFAIYSKKDNGDATVALLEVDTLNYKSSDNVEVALVTEVEAETNGNKYNYTIHGNGDVIATYNNTSASEVIGIDYSTGDDITWSDLRKIVGETGAYCEIVKDDDGDITNIIVMSEGTDCVEGKYYKVTRGVVGEVDNKSVTMDWALGATKNTIYHIDEDDDSLGTFYTDSADFYEINGTPAITYKSGSAEIQTPISDNLTSYKMELEASTGNTLIPSEYDGEDGKCSGKAEYFIADVVTSKTASKNQAEAIYQYTDSVGDAGVWVAPEARLEATFTDEAMQAGSTAGKVTATYTASSGAVVDSIKVMTKGDAPVESSDFDINHTGNIITVTPKASVKAGNYTLELKDTANDITLTHDFSVSAAVSITGVAPDSDTVVIDFGMTTEAMQAAGFDSDSVKLTALKLTGTDMVSGLNKYDSDSSIEFTLSSFDDGKMTFKVTKGRIAEYTAVQMEVSGDAATSIGEAASNVITPVDSVRPYDIKVETASDLTRALEYVYDAPYSYTSTPVVAADGADGNQTVTVEYTLSTDVSSTSGIKDDLAHFLGALGFQSGSHITTIRYDNKDYVWDTTKNSGHAYDDDNFIETATKLSDAVITKIGSESTDQDVAFTINGITVTYKITFAD